MQKKVSNINFILKASIAAFGAYFCMYAFRKPFSVASFEGLSFFGIDYKILLIIAQVIGYTISKFLGIKIISEMKQNQRIHYLIGFILLAELALLGFALVPAPYNIVFLFLNGLPLGMIWGIVFSYIEGRKATEILGVILCSSFIISSGVVKSIGKYVLDTLHFSEQWMPFITGLFFIIPLLLFSYLLEKIPSPTPSDILEKSERKPVNKTERIKLFKQFFLPLTLIILFYVFLTIIRDFRDNFAREIWDAIGYQNSTSIYSISEIPIAVIVLLILGAFSRIKNNKKAFAYYHHILILGCVAIITSTIAFQLQIISPILWMVVSGFGMYICYVPFNGLYFDRMIATFKIKGNVGFLIYIADAFGYLGSVCILLYKNFGQPELSWLDFFVFCMYSVAIIGIISGAISLTYFNNKYKAAMTVTNLSYEH